LEVDWNPDGLACEIIIPLDHLAGPRSKANGKGSL
jgi:hypothetical protein